MLQPQPQRPKVYQHLLQPLKVIPLRKPTRLHWKVRFLLKLFFATLKILELGNGNGLEIGTADLKGFLDSEIDFSSDSDEEKDENCESSDDSSHHSHSSNHSNNSSNSSHSKNGRSHDSESDSNGDSDSENDSKSKKKHTSYCNPCVFAKNGSNPFGSVGINYCNPAEIKEEGYILNEWHQKVGVVPSLDPCWLKALDNFCCSECTWTSKF